MKNRIYNFSSTQINLPEELSNEIIVWGKEHIDDSLVFYSKKDSRFGREDEIHITVLYGLQEILPIKLKHLLKGFGNFTCTLGNIYVFKKPVFDVIYIEVKSDKLDEIRNLIKKSFPVFLCYRKFTPHVTIAYTEKNKVEYLVDNEMFNGIEFEANEIILCSKKGKKTKIILES